MRALHFWHCRNHDAVFCSRACLRAAGAHVVAHRRAKAALVTLRWYLSAYYGIRQRGGAGHRRYLDRQRVLRLSQPSDG